MTIKKGTMVLIPAEYREDLEEENKETGLLYSQIIRKALKKYFEEKKLKKLTERYAKFGNLEAKQDIRKDIFLKNINKTKKHFL